MISGEIILILILVMILSPLIAIFGFIRGQQDLLRLMREERLIHLVGEKKAIKKGRKNANKITKKGD